jgi:hypothetical protein
MESEPKDPGALEDPGAESPEPLTPGVPSRPDPGSPETRGGTMDPSPSRAEEKKS